MVVTELPLTVVLLTGAGLMIRSFIKLSASDIGISTSHLMAMRMQLPDRSHPEDRRGFFERLEPGLASIAGVESIAVTTGVPPFDVSERVLEVDGQTVDPDARPRFVAMVSISPRFFDVVNVKMLRGRSFTADDGAPGAGTVIINQWLAAQFFPAEDPIGKRLRLRERGTAAPAAPWLTIVGISPPIRHGNMLEVGPTPAAYLPYRQNSPGAVSLLVRSQLSPALVMDAVRREVKAIDADQPVFTLKTLDQMLSESRWPLRVFSNFFAFLAVIALVLSSVGCTR